MTLRYYLVVTFNIIISSSAIAERTYTDFKIGAVLPLTSDLGPYGRELLNGAELAIDNFKKAHPKRGAYIKLISKDNSASEKKTTEIGEEFAKKHRVSALFGALTSNNTLALVKVATKFRRSLISPALGFQEKIIANPYVSATSSSSIEQAKVAAQFLINSLNKNRFAVILDIQSTNQVRMFRSFKTKVSNLGGKVVKKSPYIDDPELLKQALIEIKSENPQVIFLPLNIKNSAQVILQARLLGMNQKFIGTEKWDNDSAIQNKNIFSGNYFITSYLKSAPSEVLTKFRANFFRRYNREPSSVAALGYDGMTILLDAYLDAKTSRKDVILKSLKKFRSIEGAVGNMVIKNRGKYIAKSNIVVSIEDQSAKAVSIIEPEIN